MSDATSGQPRARRDILAELEAEVAHDLEEHRPPAGGPAYQVVGALVALAVGVGGAVLAYGYGLGSLRRPGPGCGRSSSRSSSSLLAVILLVVGRQLEDSERFTRVQPAGARRRARTFVGARGAAADDRLRDPVVAALRASG